MISQGEKPCGHSMGRAAHSIMFLLDCFISLYFSFIPRFENAASKTFQIITVLTFPRRAARRVIGSKKRLLELLEESRSSLPRDLDLN